MAVRCRVQEVIGVLVGLCLPQELAWELGYKWKVVEHPAAIALKTDPWLRRVREQFEQTDHQHVPNTTTCVCPRNHIEGEGFEWGTEHIHPRHTPHYWFLMSPYSKGWMKRVHGPPENSRDFRSAQCPRSTLCMRYFRHTMPLLDAHIRSRRWVGVIDQGTWLNAECVTNEDYSLTTWLRHAPPHALEEYLRGVTGWSKEKMVERMVERLEWWHGDWHINRQGIVRMCLEH